MNTVGQTVRFDKLVKEYSLVIKGLEEIKGYNHKVIVDKKLQSVAQGLRRLAYPMLEAVNQELAKTLEPSIIEEVNKRSE